MRHTGEMQDQDGQSVLISLSEIWSIVRISANAFSRNLQMLVSLCEFEHGN